MSSPSSFRLIEHLTGMCFGIAMIYLSAAVTPGQVPAPVTIDPHAEVHAVIVGISNYGNDTGKASKAADGAQKFKDVICNTYGEKAVKQFLLDENATKEKIDEALFDIQNVPSGSLVIIYFSGHGVRQKFATGNMLYLRLYGSTPTKFAAKSIKATELWKPLTFTRHTNAMIFLDCCYAGSDDEQDLVPETELNHADARAFLMCSCSREESATGDVFTRALLDVWNTPYEGPGTCRQLSDFESKVRELVRKYDTGFMTPGIAFKTKIARCITELNKPSALLVFTFPKGCRSRLDFLFDGTLVEEGFQYAKDGFLARQVSLDHPILVSVKGPQNIDIAGPFTIDPRTALPSRILEFPIDVPVSHRSEKPAVAASAFSRLPELVEFYGEPPQKHYLAAAKMLRDADPTADTSWQRRKAFVYEPNNELYAFAAEQKAITDDTVRQLAARPENAIDLAKSLESIGAMGPAAELSFKVAEATSQENSKNNLLVRAIGNLRLAGDTYQQKYLGRARETLALANLTVPQHTALRAVEDRPLNELANVWGNVPANDADWLALLAPADEQKSKALTFLTGSSAAKKQTLVAALGALKYKDLDDLQRIAYSLSDSQLGMQLSDNAIALYPRGLLPSSEPLTDWKVDHDGKEYLLSAANIWQAIPHFLYKPGFSIRHDSNQCWIASADDHISMADDSSHIKFQGPLGYECMAKDIGTAIQYSTSKPGFTTTYKDGVNWIMEVGDNNAPDPSSAYVVPAETPWAKWKNAFSNKTIAENYKAEDEIILKLPNELKVHGGDLPR